MQFYPGEAWERLRKPEGCHRIRQSELDHHRHNLITPFSSPATLGREPISQTPGGEVPLGHLLISPKSLSRDQTFRHSVKEATSWSALATRLDQSYDSSSQLAWVTQALILHLSETIGPLAPSRHGAGVARALRRSAGHYGERARLSRETCTL